MSSKQANSRRLYIDVGALAAATLLLEGTLLRLLAVAQFYHFAFLVVSLALLGFGASGTLLGVSRRLQALPLPRLLPLTGVAFAASVAVSYAVINWLPFDSYSIAWQRSQILYFALYYLALTLPFVCSGLGIGAALAAESQRSHIVYAANLVGSALGAVLALIVLRLGGVPGALLAAIAVALVPVWSSRLRWAAWVATSLLLAALIGYGALNQMGEAPLGLTISPYKGLAYARQVPGAERIFGAWNEIARVDVLQDAATRQLPGLSYTYPANPPKQLGLALDAGAIMPVTLAEPAQFDAAAYMPEAIAFDLRPEAQVLVLEPGGGLAVLQALAAGAPQVTAVSANALEQKAVSVAGEYDVFLRPEVSLNNDTVRVYLQGRGDNFDLILLPLTSPYQPVSSGAYSLAESYLLTVEAFGKLFSRLQDDGILVATRWLQLPPSESIRLLAIIAVAMEDAGVENADQHIVMIRGIQTATIFAKLTKWNADELAQLRAFAAERRFDLVWAPDISADEVNRYNRMPEALHYQAAADLLRGDRETFVREYPFAIDPPSDDKPFFYHFFTWKQTPEVFAAFGKTWQPFGGSGYFILFALLALVLVFSSVLIVLPLVIASQRDVPSPTEPRQSRVRVLAYFGLIGLAFLMVEIPLIQRWILLVGHPIYAFTAVVLTLLIFSSLGSVLSQRGWAQRPILFGALVALAVITPYVTARYTQYALGWPSVPRVAGAVLLLAPLSMLMGIPFPRGLAGLTEASPWLRPWAWAVNGCASVVSGVLAAMLALSYGFTAVLLIGALCYAGAWIAQPNASQSTHPAPA